MGFPHYVRMAKKEPYYGHYLRAWRKHGKYSLEELAGIVGTTHATLSRIERGKLPYSQPLLEALAKELETTIGSLLMRDPGKPASIWDVVEQIPASERDNAAKALTGFIKKTGQTN